MGVGEALEEGRAFVTTTTFGGPNGEQVHLTSAVNDGAMINTIDADVFEQVKHRLHNLLPSKRVLRMANGALVPSRRAWSGKIELAGGKFQASFKIFPSR